jgi:hypothetical protein
MEKDGWLDQAIYAVLNFLNQTWLGVIVALASGCAVAFLARRSPHEDWEFIRDGPDKLLLGAFLALAALKSAPRLVLPKSDFVCDAGVDPTYGLPVQTNCRFVANGDFEFVSDYTIVDMLKEFVTSAVISGACVAIGGAVGLLVAIALGKFTKPQLEGGG